MVLEKYKKYAPAVVRYGVGIVFLLFGIDQLFKPQKWIAFTPTFAQSLYVNVNTFWLINGMFDAIIGILLIIGLFTKIVAFFASVHLIGVIVILGYNDIAIRDFGLLLASIAVFLNGTDLWCLDFKLWKNR